MINSDGYCYTLDVYCGKTSEATNESLGSHVVKNLLSKAPKKPEEKAVYFDNFFTNYNWLADLKSLGSELLQLCAKIGQSDVHWAKYDHRFDKANEILMIK